MLIALMGYIGSGKDTVAEILEKDYKAERESFASTLKDATADIFNWPRDLLEGKTKESREWREKPDIWWSEKLNIKDFSPRLALQLLGTEVMRTHFNENIWIFSLENKIKEKLKDKNKIIVVSDARFPNEIKLVRELKGLIIRVERGTKPDWYDVAFSACNGNKEALQEMKTTYKSVHESEWAWTAEKPDIVIDNNGSLQDLDNKIKEIVKYNNII